VPSFTRRRTGRVYNVPGKQEKQEIIENFHKHRVKRGYDKSFHAKPGAISVFFSPGTCRYGDTDNNRYPVLHHASV
jgi:hypothetical protein